MANQSVSAICQTSLCWLLLYDKQRETELSRSSVTDFLFPSVPLTATLAPDNRSLIYSQEKEKLCNVGQTLCEQIIDLFVPIKAN